MTETLYGLAALAFVWALAKALPAVLLSQWMEDRARQRAIRSQSYLEAIVAARLAYQFTSRVGDDKLRADSLFAYKDDETNA